MNRKLFLKHLISSAAIPFLPHYLFSQKLPNILILGDSISIGYTPFVQELMKGRANVYRPTFPDGKPENCAGTTKGVENIDRWLGDTQWDVIHFNFGLHDLKHEDPETGKATKNPKDPYQADLKTYKKNLKIILGRLQQTEAQLIFATTTPVPNKLVSPLREPETVVRYNRAAVKIMKKDQVPINDLYALTLPKLTEIQRENNVHFVEAGSRLMAEKVVEEIISFL